MTQIIRLSGTKKSRNYTVGFLCGKTCRCKNDCESRYTNQGKENLRNRCKNWCKAQSPATESAQGFVNWLSTQTPPPATTTTPPATSTTTPPAPPVIPTTTPPPPAPAGGNTKGLLIAGGITAAAAILYFTLNK